jgi:hypothetical protein
MNMTKSILTRYCIKPVGIGLVLGAALNANGASAEDHQSIDVSVSGRTVTNPYLDSNNHSLEAAGSISIDPRISTGNEVTTFVINGDFRLDHYTGGYGTDQSLAVGAAVQTRLSERTVLSGGGNFTSSRLGAIDVLQIGAPPLSDPSQSLSPDVLPPDISAVGQRSRVNHYSAHVGLQHVLSPSSNIGFRLSGSYADSHDTGGQDYTNFDAAIDYDRALSERNSFLATMQVGSANYSGRSFRDATFASPLIGIRSNLNENTKLTVEGGATLTRLAGGEDHVDFAANANLCREGLHFSLCAVASRSSAPTAYEGVTTFTTAGLTYSVQPSEVDRFNLSAHYGRTDGISNLASAIGRSSTVWGGAAEYTRNLGKRTVAFIRPSVTYDRNSRYSGNASNTSVQFEIGIRQRFGDLQ